MTVRVTSIRVPRRLDGNRPVHFSGLRDVRSLLLLSTLYHDDNFWYGVTVTDDNAKRWYRYDGYHLFWSIEPLLGPVEMWETHSTEEAMIPRLPEWVIDIASESAPRSSVAICLTFSSDTLFSSVSAFRDGSLKNIPSSVFSPSLRISGLPD